MTDHSDIVRLFLDVKAPSAHFNALLTQTLQRYGLPDIEITDQDDSQPQIILTDQDRVQIPGIPVLKLPIYAGHLIQTLKRLQHQSARQTHIGPIGPYELDLNHHTLQERKKTGEKQSIKLTEKESALLELLYEVGGQPIETAHILKTIWNYADDAETHTLATHIYRLRQKIEIDPNTPEIIVTDGTAYRLKM